MTTNTIWWSGAADKLGSLAACDEYLKATLEHVKSTQSIIAEKLGTKLKKETLTDAPIKSTAVALPELPAPQQLQP